MAAPPCVLIVGYSSVSRAPVRQVLRQLTWNFKILEAESYPEVMHYLKQGEVNCLFLSQTWIAEQKYDDLLALKQPEVPAVVLGERVCSGGGPTVPWQYFPQADFSPAVAQLILSHSHTLWTLRQQRNQAYGQLQDLKQSLEQQQQQIQQQQVQLQEAQRVRSEFLATTSHELRTPLNAILGFSQILLCHSKGPLNEQQTAMVQRILNNGRHLLTLLNDILNLSKFQSGRLDLTPMALDLVEIVSGTMEELRPLAEQKQVELKMISALQNPRVVHDPDRLRQILNNLVTNGLKYTERGWVRVGIEELNAEHLLITVQDTGIGIGALQLPTIFEAFRQLDQTDKRKRAGTGLGLAIVNALVQVMGGQIEVESEVGQGSIFRVFLPRYYSYTR